MSDERRKDERLRILGNLQGEVTIVQPVRVMDVSEHGASLEIERALAIESLHDFKLPLGEMSVVVKARVAYCRISDIWPDHVVYRAGVEFIDLLPHVREAVAEHIRDIKAARHQG